VDPRLLPSGDVSSGLNHLHGSLNGQVSNVGTGQYFRHPAVKIARSL
jgi:hypothetical protein